MKKWTLLSSFLALNLLLFAQKEAQIPQKMTQKKTQQQLLLEDIKKLKNSGQLKPIKSQKLNHGATLAKPKSSTIDPFVLPEQ
jgi:hypothetical protein